MLIKLTRGRHAKVDADDFYKLSGHKWLVSKSRKRFYAARNIRKEDGKRTIIRMHKVILKAPKGFEIDHINRNTLDNRKKNLRIVTHSQNMKNYGSIGGTSKYKGVSFRRKRKKWTAQLFTNGKQTFIGDFNSEIDAAVAYDKAALKNNGEFAYLNFPEKRKNQ